MSTKSFQDICIEYAHQLGKGLPLTAPEMCNAVIMYLNTQITEMQGITTALQTAVSEAESSATEATNTANELSGKVDTLQTNVTEAESNATKALNKANDVSETVNALPKVPTPTTTDNGKVIGVQSGAYALVEQSGGEAPANMVTTNTPQTISSQKVFLSEGYLDSSIVLRSSEGNNFTEIRNGSVVFNVNGKKCTLQLAGNPQDNNVNLRLPTTSGKLARITDMPDLQNYGMYMTIVNNRWLSVHEEGPSSPGTGYRAGRIENYGIDRQLLSTLIIPNKNGTLALIDDIPDLDNYTGTMHIVQGTAGSGIAVHDTSSPSPYTKYGYNKIEKYGNSNALQYTLNIPNKNGTIATLDDIPSPSGSELYLHNVTISSADNGRIYASAITDFKRDFSSFSEIYRHIGKNVSGYYISGGDYYPIVATNIDERENIHVTVVTNSSTETFEFDAAEYTDVVKII